MSTQVVARRLDERGKVCPDPTFDTRMALNEMASGDVLEVVSDYYPTKQTIPMLMAELGYPCEFSTATKPSSASSSRRSSREAKGGDNMAKIFVVATHATDDPTKATLAFITAVGAIGAGKEVTIGLVGESGQSDEGRQSRSPCTASGSSPCPS